METLPSPSTNQPIVRINFWLDKYRWYIASVLLLLIGIISVLLMLPTPMNEIAKTDKNTLAMASYENESATDTTTATANDTEQLVVDMAGAFNRPGVYRLAPNSIIDDAINAAGGLNGMADADYVAQKINRAALLQNHGKVFVPRIGQDLPATVTELTGSTDTANDSVSANTTGMININTADAKTLESLPSIGPVLAGRIVQYRTLNGPFASIDAIKSVPGIGDATFAKFKEQITIE